MYLYIIKKQILEENPEQILKLYTYYMYYYFLF